MKEATCDPSLTGWAISEASDFRLTRWFTSSFGYLTSCVTELGAMALARLHCRLVQATVVQNPYPSLVVQPNYELLLLQPDMPTLYCLLTFSRIVQVGQISKLTLTPSSIRDALRNGKSSEEIRRHLEDFSAKALPQNVAYTIEEWSKNAVLNREE